MDKEVNDNGKQDRIRSYVSELIFNNRDKIEINKDDIVLFVGPNNAGKSQALNDIFSRCYNNSPTLVVSDIVIKKDGGSLKPLLDSVSRGDDKGNYITYNLNSHNINYVKDNGDEIFRRNANYGEYRDLFVSKLTTESRLRICQPARNINRNDVKDSPIHYAAFDYNHSKWLSENFKKAFDNNITPNILYGATIPLCIGPEVKLTDSYESEVERQDAYAKKLESYKQVQMQGDGIKSFTGILLNLMTDHYSTYLIDEPEAFLHPQQARIMGQIIGQSLRNDQQAFISTHSENIIKGLLDTCEERLKIVRITRSGDANCFSILSNDKIKDVFSDPLLKHSNIISSLFYKKIVLCESDSDCKLYSLIESYIKQKQGAYSETFFIHCGGKQRMPKTAKALLSLNVDVRIIPDIDILNDEHTVKSIAEVFGISWDDIISDLKIIAANLHSKKDKIDRENAKKIINEILDSSKEKILSSKEIKGIQDVLKVTSKWNDIKHGGVNNIPSGDARKAYNNIEKRFRDHHIYLVPVGELEGFVREVGGHGPEWVNKVLETYPDFNASVYDTIIEFIKHIDL